MTVQQDITKTEDAAPAEGGKVSSNQTPDLGMILDIPVELSLEVGRTHQTVEQVLALARGSVIELNRKAGEPLDVKINGTLVAHGEVVESNGKYGIRIIEIANDKQQIHSLL